MYALKFGCLDRRNLGTTNVYANENTLRIKKKTKNLTEQKKSTNNVDDDEICEIERLY